MGWLRKKAKQIGKAIKKIGSKINRFQKKIRKSKAFKIIAAIALATIIGPAAWATWGVGGAGTFAANVSAQTFAVTGGAFGTAAAASAAPAAIVPAAVVPTATATATSTASSTLAGSAGAGGGFSAGSGTLATGAGGAGTIGTGTALTGGSAATTAATPNLLAQIGTGITNFGASHPIVSTAAVGTAFSVAGGLISSKLAGDPEIGGRQIGEAAQERSALAELYSGYQAKYQGNAAQQMALGMNFGYDSVGYQTTA
tara:strand:+ start:982 stop:1749 length:768 start_codon:yes stop_codon:yes gene_type:complete